MRLSVSKDVVTRGRRALISHVMRSTSAEFLDRLLGERPNKFRHYSAFNGTAAPPHPPAPPHPSSLSTPCAPCAHIPPQQSCYPASSPFAIPGLNSPTAGMVPPVYSGTLQAEYSISPRSIQDLVAEGYGGYDVDALNPSLTDLQLQG